MTNEKKKEYLNSYKNLCRKSKALEEQLESLQAIEQSAKIQKLSDMPIGYGKQKDLSDYIVKLDSVLSKIIHAKKECIDRKLDIEKHIIDVTDGVESEILYKRYIQFKQWEMISLEIGYSWRDTHRKHASALQHIQL